MGSYLLCPRCGTIMPIVGVMEGERCHMCGAEYIEREEGHMPAEHNPYRNRESLDAGEMMFGVAGADPYSGPGLLAADMNAMVRRHHKMGRDEAEAEARKREEALRGDLARAYDEGFDAGTAGLMGQLAGEFYRRLIAELHFPLQAVEQGPKSKMADGLVMVRAGVTSLMEFAEGVRDAERGAG